MTQQVLRLPPLRPGWVIARVDQVASVNARIGWKALTAAEYQPDGFVFLATPNIKTRSIDFENVHFISKFRYDESAELKLRVGDVLLVKDGNTLGITNLVKDLPRPATVNGSIAVLRPRRIHPAFLRYVLASGVVQGVIDSLRAGMGVPHLFQSDIKRLPVPLPPPDVQRTIADFLDAEIDRIDTIAANSQRAATLLIERWTAVRGQVIKESSLGTSVQLRRVAQVQAGAAFPHDAQGDPDGTIPYLKVGDLSSVDEWGYVRGVDNRVTIETARSLRSPVLAPGTIVLPKIGAALLTNRRAILVSPSCLDQNVMGVTLRAGNPRYVYHCLAATDLGALSTPGPVPLLNEDAALSVRLAWPSPAEQDAIVDALDRLQAQHRTPLAAMYRQIALLRERRTALITAAITGELDIVREITQDAYFVTPFGPTVYTLKVTLSDVKPAVWRRIVVASETPLPMFASVLEAAMGWEGYHLHMFDVSGILFGKADEDADYLIDERCATVKHLLPKLKSKLQWTHDFGDGWEHDVVVETIESPQERKRYPLCLDGKRACPPEDCGGVPGYYELLRVLADPNDDEHDHMVSWAPEGFDPAAFDLVAANGRMQGR